MLLREKVLFAVGGFAPRWSFAPNLGFFRQASPLRDWPTRKTDNWHFWKADFRWVALRCGKEHENRGSKFCKGLDGVFLRSRARSIRFFATFEKLRPFTPCSLQKAAPCHGCTEQVLVALVVCVAAQSFFTYRLYRGGNFSSVLRRWSFLCLAVLFLRRSGYFRRVHLFLLGRGVFLRCFPPLYGWMRVAGVLFGATSAKFGAIPCNCFT